MKKQKKLPAFSAVIFAAAVIGFFAACDTGNGGGSSDGAFTDGGSGTPGVSGGTPGSGTSSSGPAVSTDSWDLSENQETVNYDIISLEADNQGNYLYVTVGFRTPLALWTDDRIGVVISAEQNKNIDVSADGETKWMQGAATSVTGSADYAWWFSVWQSSGSSSGYNLKGSSENASVSIAEVKVEDWVIKDVSGDSSITFNIPMADLGNPAPGTEIKVFAAVSNMWSDGSVALKDGIPAAAISSTSNNDTVLSIDMSRALSYTVR